MSKKWAKDRICHFERNEVERTPSEKQATHSVSEGRKIAIYRELMRYYPAASRKESGNASRTRLHYAIAPSMTFLT